MFGLLRRNKPATLLDKFIEAVYGNPRPPKRAILGEAIDLAFEDLLLNQVSKSAITEVATELNRGPIPYSTHDLAVSAALNFFKRPEMMPVLR